MNTHRPTELLSALEISLMGNTQLGMTFIENNISILLGYINQRFHFFTKSYLVVSRFCCFMSKYMRASTFKLHNLLLHLLRKLCRWMGDNLLNSPRNMTLGVKLA